MTDLYLSFADEAAAKAVLYTDVPVEWEPAADPTEPPVPTAWQARPNFLNIDTIGVIYKPTGETDAEGNPVMQAIPGWHVNVRLMPDEDGSALSAYQVNPATPVRVWG